MMGGTLLSLLKGGDVGDAVVDGGDGGDVDVVLFEAVLCCGMFYSIVVFFVWNAA